MTKRERDQVVELLRCAADLWQQSLGGIGVASSWLGTWGRRWQIACRAWDSTVQLITRERYAYPPLNGVSYGDVCLEAAARVEEGSWP